MSKRNVKRAAKAAKNHPKIVTAFVIILVILIAGAAILWYFRPDLFNGLFNFNNTNDSPDAPLSGERAEIAEADFSIHFLDVGNKYTGDCILIDCGDTEVLIDAGSRKNSGSTLIEYINNYCNDGKLEYVIATHSDQDHISAFLGEANKNNGIFNSYDIGTFIYFDKSGKTPTSTSLYGQFLNAVENLPATTSVFTASQCYEQQGGASRQYFLNEDKTLSINILYNYYYYNVDKSNENNHSVVTLLTYEGTAAKSHYLFTGDLEAAGEAKLVEYYKNGNGKGEYDILPEVELFKAGHHGSYTASTEDLLKIIKPKNIAVSCCTGSDEYASNPDHYFPAQEFIDRVAKYTENVYCTNIISEDGSSYRQMNGNIVFYLSGGQLRLWCSNNTVILKDTEWFKQYRSWNN